MKNFERQALNAIDGGDTDFDARRLRARLNADPRDLAARIQLAKRYEKAGFPDVAIEHYELACERLPDSAEAHLALAGLLRREHREGEAAAILSAFASGHADQVEIWAWLGVVADEAGDFKAGETAHRKAIALAPRRADLLNNLGFCLLEQNRRPEAAETFQAALAVDPTSRIARNNLGLALAEKPAEAVRNWESVAGTASAHNNMAVALMEAGKYGEARRELRVALEHDPAHAAALGNLRLLSEIDGGPGALLSKMIPVKRKNRLGIPRRQNRGNDLTVQDKTSGIAVASSRQGTN